MPTRDLVVVGASAGGVEALKELVRTLDPAFPATVVLVLHLPEDAASNLTAILARVSSMPVSAATDGATLVPGRVLVAPSGSHVVVVDGGVALSAGPRENGHRPSIDVLFRSAARAHRNRVVGVILSGALDDGTAGLLAIKGQGGATVVQDPDEALFDGMPRSALANVDIDHVTSLADLAALLVELCSVDVGSAPAVDLPELLDDDVHVALFDPRAVEEHRPGHPSPYACPDCNGVLWEVEEWGIQRFRCRVGHAWSSASLLAEKQIALEASLWAALRALEEQADLADRLADRAAGAGTAASEGRFRDRSTTARAHAAHVRELLVREGGGAQRRGDG